MSSLTLSLMGPPRLERDGAPVHISRHKAVALLAYLAVTGQTHRRDTLATLLWPEHDRSHARAGLRRALAALKGTLGEGWLDAERETIGLNRDAEIVLDVRAFRERLAACRGHAHPSHEVCPTCLTLLGEAVALGGGDFMAGFSLRDSPTFDDWQLFQSQELRDELAGALERLVVGHSARGEFEPAIAYARRWLALDPLHEATHRRLIELYAWSGQRAAALRQYEGCERVLREELGVSPEEETIALHRSIVEHRGLPAPVERISPAEPQALPRRHNLPAQLIPFVGREAVLVEIGRRLEDPGCRLLSLIGPGGSGKTRLALKAAARQVDHYPHGVFFVSLAPLDAVGGIVPTVAQALGFSFHGEGEPKKQLLNHLREKSMLLILDNYEHLLDGVTLVTEILETAPGVVVVATSRVRLSVRGEHCFPVGGLNYPGQENIKELVQSPSKKALQYSAIQLFVQSARRARPDFELTVDVLGDVVRICRLVEGLPLGILLAATWADTLTPAEIGAEIEGQMTGSGLDFLETDWRDVPARQRSMRAVFDHSWDLLTEREREILSGVSVFRGGFTRGTAERVVDASLRALTTLVHKSLLHRLPGGRYEMHELVRQYAASKLAALPDAERQVRDRHCATYAAALQRWSEALKGPRQLAALAEIEAEIENIRAAWAWAVERVQERIRPRRSAVERLDQAMEGLALFCDWRARYREGESLLSAAAEALAPSQVPASSIPVESLRVGVQALAWQGLWAYKLGCSAQARECLGRGMDLLDGPLLADQDTRRERALTLWVRGQFVCRSANHQEAGKLYAESLALYRALGDRWGAAEALYALEEAAESQGDFQEARRLSEEALSIRRVLGDARGIAESLGQAAWISMCQGSYDEAERLGLETVALARGMNNRTFLARVLYHLGLTLRLQGKFTESLPLLKESLSLFDTVGLNWMEAQAAATLGLTETDLGRYEDGRRHIEQTLALSRETDSKWHIGLGLYCLAFVALVEKKHIKARQCLQKSAAIFRSCGQRSTLGWPLALLGTVESKLGQSAQAREHLKEALLLSEEMRDGITPRVALPAAALLFAGLGQAEQAVEIYALALRYPFVANSRVWEDVAGGEIAALAATLSQEVAAAAQERGQDRELWATVKELLAELGGP